MATVLPDIDIEKVKGFCHSRIRDAYRDEIRLEVTTRGRNLSIHECRPPWDGSRGEWSRTPVAQLRYNDDGTWTLYYSDHNNKWARYINLGDRQPVDAIINELETDPTCLFWG